MKLRLGTRASLLATTQSGTVADALRALGHDVELVEIVSEGDLSQASGVSLVGSATGVFVNALRDALLDGRIDLAVHSLKDLPTAPADGLEIAAIPTREDASDVLVSRDGFSLLTLPEGARVGTGSPRRVSQLLAQRPDLDLVGVRGNIDTRIGKVRSGEYHAVVLARAGLARIGRLDDVAQVIPPHQILPSPGQGALAVECVAGSEAAGVVAGLDDTASHAEVTAERVLLRVLEGGCSAAIGAYARLEDGHLTLEAIALNADGTASIRDSDTAVVADDGNAVAAAASLGVRLAQTMLAAGADKLLSVDSTSTRQDTGSDKGSGDAAPRMESA